MSASVSTPPRYGEEGSLSTSSSQRSSRELPQGFDTSPTLRTESGDRPVEEIHREAHQERSETIDPTSKKGCQLQTVVKAIGVAFIIFSLLAAAVGLISYLGLALPGATLLSQSAGLYLLLAGVVGATLTAIPLAVKFAFDRKAKQQMERELGEIED